MPLLFNRMEVAVTATLRVFEAYELSVDGEEIKGGSRSALLKSLSTANARNGITELSGNLIGNRV